MPLSLTSRVSTTTGSPLPAVASSCATKAAVAKGPGSTATATAGSTEPPPAGAHRGSDDRVRGGRGGQPIAHVSADRCTRGGRGARGGPAALPRSGPRRLAPVPAGLEGRQPPPLFPQLRGVTRPSRPVEKGQEAEVATSEHQAAGVQPDAPPPRRAICSLLLRAPWAKALRLLSSSALPPPRPPPCAPPVTPTFTTDAVSSTRTAAHTTCRRAGPFYTYARRQGGGGCPTTETSLTKRAAPPPTTAWCTLHIQDPQAARTTSAPMPVEVPGPAASLQTQYAAPRQLRAVPGSFRGEAVSRKAATTVAQTARQARRHSSGTANTGKCSRSPATPP